MRIGFRNAADSGTFTCDRSTPAALGPANLGSSLRSLILRTTGTSTSVTLGNTWAADERVAVVGVFGLPVGYDYTVHVEYYASLAWHTIDIASYENGVCANSQFAPMNWPVEGNIVIYPATPVTCRGIRVTISHIVWTGPGMVTTGSALTWQASRLWAGDYWQPATSVDYPVERGIIDTSAHTRSAGGSLRTKAGTTHRTWTLPLSFLTDAELTILQQEGLLGTLKTADRLVSPFAGEGSAREAAGQWIGRLSNDVALALASTNLWSMPLVFEEI